MRILFVEDNDTVRGLISELLAEGGSEVTACASAEAAEDLFDQITFDVVLTDMNLPQVSGTELARRLLVKRPEVWIVFASGTKYDCGRGKWGPHVRSMAKPFDDNELTALLEEISSINASGN